MKNIISALVTSLSFFSLEATAIAIEYYDITQTGNHYEYSYNIINDDPNISIEEFGIYFEPNLYENLEIIGSPEGWDPLVFATDTTVPDNGGVGIADWLAWDADPLAPGNSLNGFTLAFDWIGSGDNPTDQLFEVLDWDLSVLASGTTSRQASNVSPVPIPSSLSLMFLGFGGFWLSSIRRKRLKTIS